MTTWANRELLAWVVLAVVLGVLWGTSPSSDAPIKTDGALFWMGAGSSPEPATVPMQLGDISSLTGVRTSAPDSFTMEEGSEFSLAGRGSSASLPPGGGLSPSVMIVPPDPSRAGRGLLDNIESDEDGFLGGVNVDDVGDESLSWGWLADGIEDAAVAERASDAPAGRNVRDNGDWGIYSQERSARSMFDREDETGWERPRSAFDSRDEWGRRRSLFDE